MPFLDRFGSTSRLRGVPRLLGLLTPRHEGRPSPCSSPDSQLRSDSAVAFGSAARSPHSSFRSRTGHLSTPRPAMQYHGRARQLGRLPDDLDDDPQVRQPFPVAESSYVKLRITASMFSARLCAAAAS
jgi:hypothetical protein